MKFAISVFILAVVLLDHSHRASAITIPTVPVGNPGNISDRYTDLGTVDYNYRIGTTEVTNSQYAEFLNAKAASDPLDLYNTAMGLDNRGGISRNGVSGNYTYAVRSNMGDKPVIWVSWFDAIRFANWLNNGQGSGNTETGAYALLGGTSLPSNWTSISRNEGASWFLTSENEWYKAAYYQPAAQGGDFDSYWLYPTRSNAKPNMATVDDVGNISNPGANVVNYGQGTTWNSQFSNVTTVGSAGELSESFYGTSDQGGNVWEWNETLTDGYLRDYRGGGSALHDYEYGALQRGYRVDTGPYVESGQIGFRVATVPEPSTLVLGAFGLLVFAAHAWRRILSAPLRRLSSRFAW